MAGVDDRQVVVLKRVLRPSDRATEAADRVRHRNRIRILGLCEDTDSPVLGDWASSPTKSAMSLKPRVSHVVVDVCRIEQSDQDVNVEQSSHSQTLSSKSSSTILTVTVVPPAGSSSKPLRTLSVSLASLRNPRRASSEITLPCCRLPRARDLLRSDQHIVINV